MNLTFVPKAPDKAYVADRLWLPKSRVFGDGLVRPEPVKKALEFSVPSTEGQIDVTMWQESRNHIICPREFLPPSEYAKYRFPFVDLRPQFQKVHFEDLVVPRNEEQERAWSALAMNENGILVLACVAGDTVINLNRAGKGFSTTIQDAFIKMSGGGPKQWDLRIPTYTRALVGSGVNLHRLWGVAFNGHRMTNIMELEDGKVLRLTSDHKVMTPSGFKVLENLKVGDEVLTDGTRRESILQPKVTYHRSSWYPSHPYVRSQWRPKRNAFSYQIETHRAVFEAKLNGLTFDEYRSRCREGAVDGLRFVDPSIFHIHHRDENPFNNDPDNLEMLLKEEHLRHHRPGSKAFGYGTPIPSKIRSITPHEVEPVFDLMCEAPHHNYVANGVIVHNCGKGKTKLAVKKIAQDQKPTLVVVPDGGILEQWKESILGNASKGLKPGLLFEGELGLIQGPVFNWARPVTLALVTTLWRRIYDGAIPEDLFRYFGRIIYDEVHQIGAPKFSLTAEPFYGDRLGLTATLQREDGLDPIYRYHIGEPFYTDLSQDLIPEIFFQKTTAVVPLESADDASGKTNMSLMRSAMGRNYSVNVPRYWSIRTALEQGRKVLCLSHSRDQLALFHAMFPGSGLIVGSTPKHERMEILRRSQVCFAISKLGSTGVDDDALDILLWLTPFRSKIALQQSFGRVQRSRPGKKQPVVIIFEDWHCAPLKRMCAAIKGILREWKYDYKPINPPPFPHRLPPEVQAAYDRAYAELPERDVVEDED